MAEYRYPRALDDVEGHAPAAVDLHGEYVPIDEDGTFTSGNETAVRALASAYDLTLEDLRVGESDAPDDGEECGAEMSDGSTCERLASECPYHDN